jgi:predicted RecA/RadA family phage recombinase
MSAECLVKDAAGVVQIASAAAALASGEVLQLPDGRAGYVAGLHAVAAGDPAAIQAMGVVTLPKTASVVVLKGDLIYWDRSANTATPLQAVTGADFKIGVAVADAAAADATVDVELNGRPKYLISLVDLFDTVLVLTAGTPAMSMGPGYSKLAFSATAEAQKVDILSKQSVPVTIPFIVEGRIAIYDIGDEASVDINVGLANATHATDADSITERMFLHLDGTSLNIMAESGDGTTTVASVDTTVDAVDDTFFDFRMDCRNLADIQLYINGVNVLPATVFRLDAATGPLKLLAHIEKGANDTPGDVRIAHLAIRTMDVE